MPCCPLPLLLLVTLLPIAQLSAQVIAADLQSPVSVVADRFRTAYVLLADGRIFAHRGEERAEILDAFPDEEDGPPTLVKLLLSNHNLMTTVGLSGERVRLETHRLVKDQPPKPVDELSGHIILGDPASQLFAATASDFAFYFAVGGKQGSASLLRLPASGAGFEASRVIWSQASPPRRPTAMCVSPLGHLAVIMADESSSELVLLHAETGKLLQKFSTDMQAVRALASAPSGVLVAAGRRATGEPGIFRLDAAMEGSTQLVRAHPLTDLDNIVDIACPAEDECLAVVGGSHGQLVKLDLPAGK